MFRDIQKFVTTFRDLEQQQFSMSHEEEKVWKKLRDKLSVPIEYVEPETQSLHKTIVVASLYSQAGASFIAGNYAWCLATREIMATLAEHPNQLSYYYFALDMERRSNSFTTDFFHQSKKFRVKVGQLSNNQNSLSQMEIAKWFFTSSKSSSVFIIDLSSKWRDEISDDLMEWADEVWFVFDNDLPRLARTISLVSPPKVWSEHRHKIKLIANKWNDSLERSSVRKRIEGTFSLWEHDCKSKKVDMIMPFVGVEKMSMAHVEGKLYLEVFPECIEVFEGKINCR